MHVGFTEETDEFLSPLDIKSTINTLSEADLLRLNSIAQQYSSYCSMDSDEILNEAILKALIGSRKCPINVSFIAFIYQTMRSIAFNEKRKNEKFEPIDNTTSPLQGKSALPEDKTSAHQELESILNLFENDDDITLYLMGIYDGCTPNEICELGDWNKTKYSSIQRKLRRSLNKHYPNGREK